MQRMREEFHSKMSPTLRDVILEILCPCGSAVMHWLVIATVSFNVHSEEHLDMSDGQ